MRGTKTGLFTEQSGLFAGKGGFDITVGSHTQLDGGVIASTAEKEKNRLDTGTLGWSDIHNKADWDVSHQGADISSGGSVGGQFVGNMANNTLVGANGSGHDSSTTHAAVEDGTIIIRDKDKQQQDVATLDRDTEHEANGLSPIFDKEKEQKRLQEAQVIGEIGSQVGDIARTQGEIAGQKAAKDPAALNAAREQLAAGGKPYTESDVAQQAYNNAMAPWGTGGAIQQGIQAATAAIQGLAGGNVGQLLSGAAAPYLAKQIHKLAPDETSRAMAHAVVGAIVSYEAGNSAAAGAAGAVSGELMAQLVMNQLYPGKRVSDLTETEKQTVSVLGTLAAGLAGGITGGSAADGMAGAQAGKNSVENNALSSQDEKQRQDAKWSLPYIKDEKQKQQAEKLISDLNAKDKAFDAKLNAACQGLSSAACQGMRQELAAMAKSYDEQLDGQYIGTMGSVYKKGKDQVDALMWQYATADAKAEREANVNRIAENWDVSKEAADGLYTAMAGVHTTAAIGGAIYGMKGLTEKPAGTGAVKQPSESGRSPTPAPGKLAVDEEAGYWSQYDKYRRDPYNWNWPEKLGFAGEPVKTTIPVGTRLDRYSEPSGSFLAPKGTPYGERALAPGAKAEKYYEYEVVKPLPVIQGKIAPAFGEPGGGVQILPNMEQRVNIEWLIDKGYLKEIK